MKDTRCRVCSRDTTGQPASFVKGWWYCENHQPTMEQMMSAEWKTKAIDLDPDNTPGETMSTPKTYRKKPTTIEALQWTGDNGSELQDWCGQHFYERSPSECADGLTASLFVKANANWLGIETGEWVAKDRHGFYPIRNDVFAETYDPVTPEGQE